MPPVGSICYDICPPYNYGNPIFLLCYPCPYDCYTCSDINSSMCTSCSTIDFRQLNIITGRCDPMPTYYDDGTNTATALHCN